MFGVLKRYFSGKKCYFYLCPKVDNDRHEVVVMVHGLIRRSYDMYPMGRYLCKYGFTVYVYDYKTLIKNISEHGNDLRDYLCKVINENPDIPINIVTHSMGGILTRYALAKDAEDSALDISRIKRIVMLAPPHGGSNVARVLTKHLPLLGKWVKPLPELSNDANATVHSAPLIDGPEIGIIAAKYDNEVAIKDTYFPGMKEHFILRSEHSFMVYLVSVRKAVLRFLTKGTFY